MKLRSGILFTVALNLLHLQDAPAQLPAAQQKAIVIKRVIEMQHYAPRTVDDSFSVHVFRSFINTTDSRRLLFTKDEYQQLSAFSTTLDDELSGHKWQFLPAFTPIYKKALLRADTIIQQLLQKPFDFSADEKITVAAKSTNPVFAGSVTELKQRWGRYLKWMALNLLYSAADADSTLALPYKTLLQRYESSIRQKTGLIENRLLAAILQEEGGPDKKLEQQYLNCIATAFDPHTSYFSPEVNSAFREELSSDENSFGMELEENEEGRIVIEHLVPGGPAWKNGEINQGDELIEIQVPGKSATDISTMPVDDILEMLEEPAHKQLQFKFRKPNGLTRQLTLRKEKISNEESIVKSFILTGEKKIAYILLPGFYTQWEKENGSSCANDVAKEIVKLKKENIDGLILDVRYNGGGSLGEALGMAGIFIDEGPLFGQKQKAGKAQYIKDPNRGTIYDGPMVLLVNGQSASASELLAATLQDYNRAVIAGSVTYGKATMQVIVPADSSRTSANSTGDFIKLTIGKIFRLTGFSAQLNGVQPDIPLPDIFDGIEYREKYQPAALRPDTIAKNNYYKPLPALPLSSLAAKSAARVSQNAAFRSVQEQVNRQKLFVKAATVTIPLQWTAFQQWKEKNDPDEASMEDAAGTTPGPFKAGNHTADNQFMQTSEYAAAINKSWLERLEADLYIREAFAIACDLAQSVTTSPK